MRVRSGHIILNRRIRYKDLAPIYRDLYVKFLKESNQLPNDETVLDVLVKTNLLDLKRNRKPEGFNREGTMRLIFPITDNKNTGIQFYIYKPMRSTEVVRITDVLSKFLHQKGFKHDVEWDKMPLYKNR